MFLGLAAEGYSIEYKRVPMSRERTPRTDDLDHLFVQMNPEVSCADKRIIHVFVSRTASGSSARFAATFACGCLLGRDASDIADRNDRIDRDRGPAPSSGDSSMHRVDSGAFDLSRSVENGEYRGGC